MGSTKKRASLRATEALLYPKIKANSTEEHRNACGTKESTTGVVGKCSLPPLSSSVSCSCSRGSDRAPGGTLTCLVPPALAQENSSSCCSHTRHSWPQICLLLCICHRLRSQPNLAELSLSSRESKARCQGRARKDTHRAAVGPDLSALSYKQGSSHSSDKSPIASALEPAVHHRHLRRNPRARD